MAVAVENACLSGQISCFGKDTPAFYTETTAATDPLAA
jgi:hypothetical protein